MALSCVGIVIILRWYGTKVFLFLAAVTDKRSLV